VSEHCAEPQAPVATPAAAAATSTTSTTTTAPAAVGATANAAAAGTAAAAGVAPSTEIAVIVTPKDVVVASTASAASGSTSADAGTTVIERRDGSEHTFAAGYSGFGADRAASDEAYDRSFASGDFSLPRDHRVTQDLRPGYEPASMDTALSSSNRGFRLLQKMGWQENTSLGRKGDGLLEPIAMKFRTAGDTLGIGKDTEYDEMGETAAAERKKYLEVEMDLTEEEKAARLEKHEAKEETQRVVANNNRHFYCETCAKQFCTLSGIAILHVMHVVAQQTILQRWRQSKCLSFRAAGCLSRISPSLYIFPDVRFGTVGHFR
jgi:hypothetical protein